VLADLTPICRKPMSVIGHGNIAGVDLTYFVADQPDVLTASAVLTAKYQLKDKKVFCFVGRLNRDKGIKELCQAFTQLDPNHHALLVVGGLDTEKPVDDATLQLLQHAPGIHWLGFQSDVRIALAASDVFVLPSYREGFPNVVLQAAAMAKPALVTNVSGSNEIVQHGFNGWIVPPKDASALLAQLRVISQMTDSMLSEHGQNALQRIQQRFDRKVYQVQLLKFYQGIFS
jgi:glycosyltransferase involved in cell wall biosynthesis